MNQIEIMNLKKNFKNTVALDDVSVTFRENTIYGLLGRNGAGKSTLLNIITNRIFATSGTVTVDGEPGCENDNAQKKIYLMSEQNCYPDGIKVKDAWTLTKSFYPYFDEPYAYDLAKKFDLNTGKAIKSLSTGYLSIFKLITSLSVNVPYLFLDEPVLGLDANNRDLFYRLLLEKYTKSPSTIVISTHLIEEIANIIEHVIIIKEGNIIRDESLESLLSSGYTISGPADSVSAYITGRETLGVDRIGGLASAYLIGKPAADLPSGLEISSLDLQKLFIQLTNY